MRFSRFIPILAVILIVLCSLNFISANELDNTTITSSNENEVINIVDDEKLVMEEVNSELNGENIDDSSDEGYVIYVGQNTEDGNGTLENPFKNFTLACNNVTGQEKVTLKILSGEYYFGGMYYFNTTDLNIEGIGGKVIIKTQFTDTITKERQIKTPMGEGFGLISDTGKFSIENIIFNSTGRTYKTYLDGKKTYFFEPFHIYANGGFFSQYDIPTWNVDIVGLFRNCTFISEITLLRGFEFNCTFDKCRFDSTLSELFIGGLVNNTNHIFNYCSFNYYGNRLTSFYYWPFELRMDNCWFGQNSLPSYIRNFASYTYNTTGIDSNWDPIVTHIQLVSNYTVPISRYANFNVTQNYLGDDKYEIIGKLTWNGTDSREGMENFQPMTVKLESDTGVFDSPIVILTNGNFRTEYTSLNAANKVTVTLDNEEIELNFTKVDIGADPVNIYYGDDQNIAINFTQNITSNVTVTVSNGTYNKSDRIEVINKNSTIYALPDRLKEGTYSVEICLVDSIYHGSNATTFTVSKVSDYTFEVVTGSVKVGETTTVNITLPADVNGTVVIKFGNDTKELDANQTMTVKFTNLNATTYSVNVSYKGNDKYVAKDYPTAFVTVDPADSVLEIEDATFTYGEPIAIPFNMTNADGVDVAVYNQDNDPVATASSDSGIINLDALPAGKYSLDVETIVGSNYISVLKTIDLTINKANSSLDISDKEFAYVSEAVINAVTENSTGMLLQH